MKSKYNNDIAEIIEIQDCVRRILPVMDEDQKYSEHMRHFSAITIAEYKAKLKALSSKLSDANILMQNKYTCVENNNVNDLRKTYFSLKGLPLVVASPGALFSLFGRAKENAKAYKERSEICLSIVAELKETIRDYQSKFNPIRGAALLIPAGR